MKIKCLRDIASKVGRRRYILHKGKILDVPYADALLFVERNLAVMLEEEVKEITQEAPVALDLTKLKLKVKVKGVKVEAPLVEDVIPEEVEEKDNAIPDERELSNGN